MVWNGILVFILINSCHFLFIWHLNKVKCDEKNKHKALKSKQPRTILLAGRNVLDPNHCRQPAQWLHDPCLEILTVHICKSKCSNERMHYVLRYSFKMTYSWDLSYLPLLSWKSTHLQESEHRWRHGSTCTFCWGLYSSIQSMWALFQRSQSRHQL